MCDWSWVLKLSFICKYCINSSYTPSLTIPAIMSVTVSLMKREDLPRIAKPCQGPLQLVGSAPCFLRACTRVVVGETLALDNLYLITYLCLAYVNMRAVILSGLAWLSRILS